MPAARAASKLVAVRRILERDGLLLLHDAQRPSLTALVAGGPIRGSWWGHPAGGEIFRAASALEEAGEALFLPLLGGKVTLLHPRLWTDLAAVGEEHGAWQLSGLDRPALALLAEVESAGRLRASGAPAKELARALLVHAAQVHTERGAHATELQTWADFRKQQKLGRRRPAAAGRTALETTVTGALGAPALSLLPWRPR